MDHIGTLIFYFILIVLFIFRLLDMLRKLMFIFLYHITFKFKFKFKYFLFKVIS